MACPGKESRPNALQHDLLVCFPQIRITDLVRTSGLSHAKMARKVHFHDSSYTFVIATVELVLGTQEAGLGSKLGAGPGAVTRHVVMKQTRTTGMREQVP